MRTTFSSFFTVFVPRARCVLPVWKPGKLVVLRALLCMLHLLTYYMHEVVGGQHALSGMQPQSLLPVTAGNPIDEVIRNARESSTNRNSLHATAVTMNQQFISACLLEFKQSLSNSNFNAATFSTMFTPMYARAKARHAVSVPLPHFMCNFRAILLACLFVLASEAVAGDPSQFVDPFIGTGGVGFGIGSINPGAQAPFGALRLGPDTSLGLGTHVDCCFVWLRLFAALSLTGATEL